MTVRFLDPDYTEQYRESINNDPEFQLAARFMKKDVMLGVGDSGCIIRVNEGVISEIVPVTVSADTCDFSIKGTVESWEKFLQTLPPPHYSGLFSAMISCNLLIEGDMEAAFAYFWAMTRLLDILRELQNQ